MLLNLTLFGQQLSSTLKVSDSFKIEPYNRFVENQDTFTVFSLKQERQLVYLLSDYKSVLGLVSILNDKFLSLQRENKYLEDQLLVTDSVLTNNQLLLNQKNTQISNLKNHNKVLNKQLQDNKKKLWFYTGAGIVIGCIFGLVF